MTIEYKKAIKEALSNAAELIKSHPEGGGLREETFNGEFSVDQYVKACDKVYKMLELKASKIETD